jgi:hypothetical protein
MIDGGGSGRDKNDDNRVDVKEWMAGYKNVSRHGFVALQGISSKAEALELFMKIDVNGGGQILLDEWCTFLKNCEVAAHSLIGEILVAESPGKIHFLKQVVASKHIDPVDEEICQIVASSKKKKSKESTWSLPSPKTRPNFFLKSKTRPHVFDDDDQSNLSSQKTPELLAEEINEWLANKSPYSCDSAPNSFGLAVGKSVSLMLLDFISVFEPLVAETSEGEALRAKGFISADPNGNCFNFQTYGKENVQTFKKN